MTYVLQLQSIHSVLPKHLHTLSFHAPVRVEDLICEIIVCLEPTSDGVNDRQPISSIQGGSPLDLSGEELTHSPSLSLQQGGFATEGLLQRRKIVLLPRTHS